MIGLIIAGLLALDADDKASRNKKRIEEQEERLRRLEKKIKETEEKMKP